MSSNITIAKSELFQRLHKNYEEVVGASIRVDSSKKEYIVILLSRMTSRVRPHLPADYKGNRVTHEIVGSINALR